MALGDMTLIFAEEENQSLNKLKERLVAPDRVEVPWKEDKPLLPDNHHTAL